MVYRDNQLSASPLTQINRGDIAPYDNYVSVYERELETKRKRRRNLGVFLVSLFAGAGLAYFQSYGSEPTKATANSRAGQTISAEEQGNQNVSAPISKDKYLPPEILCQPIAKFALRPTIPIEWKLDNLPITSDLAFPDMGKGVVSVDSCVGNVVNYIDKDATERTGIKTYTLKPSDISYTLNVEDYENGFPKRDDDQLMEEIRAGNPSVDDSTVKQAASIIQENLKNYDATRRKLHRRYLEDRIASEYGSTLVERAQVAAKVVFDSDVKAAGLNDNAVWLRFSDEATESSKFEFVTNDDSPPNLEDLPFIYKSNEVEGEMKAYEPDDENSK